MPKVLITYFNKHALVDQDQVKLLQRKELIVREVSDLMLLKDSKNDSTIQVLSSKIISLNKRIRKNVQFV